MSKNTFFISTPKNIYSSINISIVRGLEAVILTGTVVTTGVSKMCFFVGLMCLKILKLVSVPLKMYT